MLTPLRLALILLCLFYGGLAQMTDLKSSIYVRQDSSYFRADVGDSVTLQCFYEGSAVMFFWYKQSLGEKPKPMSSFYRYKDNADFLDEFKDNPRFRLDTGNGKNHLTILNLSISDSATYYCLGSYGYEFEFVEGATVSVRGSGLSVPALVSQSESGGFEDLSCTVHTGTCNGDHSVYWFRNSEEAHPGLIYTHGDRDDHCERKPNTQVHSCGYNLPMKNGTGPEAEADLCAVVSCGHVLFGDKMKSDMERSTDKTDPFVLVLILAGALAFNIMLVVSLAFGAYRKYQRNRCLHTADHGLTMTLRPYDPYKDFWHDNQEMENLHYAALRVKKTNSRSTRLKDPSLSECVYSGVRQ
ncbi:uncharacterized protein LOC121504955 [Cheilinus undulatus]|uniref:uncharacterized protein LOC121504955 n=1 Tax=Cheilinus undulatus TaxID=241271 RepID=UPI001BD27084|nr:uncharacterized protein LOC121504955 [Cheilinus undulatus]